MSPLLKIMKFELRNIFRSKWVIFYTLFFFLLTEALFQFGGSGPKAIVSLMNVALLLIPIVSIIFGTIYVYNSREFIELLLTQPVKRRQVFMGLHFGLSHPLAFAFVLGVGLPFLLNGTTDFYVLMTLLLAGFLNTLIFINIAIIIALKFDDRSMGIGMAILIWFFFAVIYDGLLMFFIWQFSDYPLETAMIGLTVINPIDLGRVLIMLQFDVAALMGYTGALFEKFFGGGFGMVISLIMMLVWALVPFFYGMFLFEKKNF